uniref:glutathione-specific gamma-glutamylcyclotransferase n=1 Tax=Macrostomum lignano TaxID=282301 RepID=A0A1I8ILN3_9PLAT
MVEESPESVEVAEAAAAAAAADGPPLRIFGYGSLIWRPGFPYSGRIVGFAPGFKRRFYKGSPGRVATLLPDPECCTWGVLYEVSGAESVLAAMAHLSEREARLGGYRLRRVTFRPLSAPSTTPPPDITAFTYVAEPDNPRYLGEAGLDRQARQVAMATGRAGANADYVRGVARFMACEVPDGPAQDRHVAELARLADTAMVELTRPSPMPAPSALSCSLAMAP